MTDINDMIRQNLNTETNNGPARPFVNYGDDNDLVIDYESEDEEMDIPELDDSDDDYIYREPVVPNADSAAEENISDTEIDDIERSMDKIGEDIEIDHSIYAEGYQDEETIVRNKKIGRLIFILTIIIAALTAFGIKTIFVSAIYVPSESMQPTISKGEIVLGNSIDLFDMDISRGDIIIFRYPKQIYKKYIKRVIGLPGDRVVIAQNRIYINDEVYPLEEPYVKADTWTNKVFDTKDIKVYNVPKGEYFVLGDNRNNSEDSRYWGFVPGSYISAKGKYVIHSLAPFKMESLQ